MSEEALQRIAENKKTKAKTLDLSDCGIKGKLPIELAELIWLEELELQHNDLAVLPPTPQDHFASAGEQTPPIQLLTSLIAIRQLDLRRTGVADVSPLAGLAQLQTLWLNDTQVADLSPLAGLAQLQELQLDDTKVADLSPLAGLAQLKRLYLDNTQVADISTLAGLAQLQTLSLSKTQVADLPPLAGLAQLQTLQLNGTKVADLSPLAGLAQLQTLSLSNTQVADISPLAGLAQLQSLYLYETQIADISPLAGLVELQTLQLGRTKVADLSPLAGLAQLQRLYLYETQLADISPLKLIIEEGIKVRMDGYNGIIIGNCPLTNPPLEIVKQGNEAILNYWIQEDKVPLYEAKVLLVGDPNSGKTTLARRMFWEKMEMPKAEERTVGIDIHQTDYRIANGETMRLNVWDFAGQEVRHATHQFFFTHNSIYVLLDDTSENHVDVQDPFFRNWLGWIELLGGESPVFIFQNEKDGRSRAIDFKGIQRRYDKVEAQFRGDLVRIGSADGIKAALQERATRLDHIGALWPQKWIAIRRALEENAVEKPIIPFEVFLGICEAHGEIDNQKAALLSGFFHNLGVCLHFQDDEVLRDWIILQNHWATDAVYLMLADETVKERGKGRFRQADRDRVWGDTRYRHCQAQLMALMERFDLCYYLKDTLPKEWIVPQMLHPSIPEGFSFEPEADELVVQYRYRYMPKGLINRLMTRHHRFVPDPGKAWRSGVLFDDGHAQLLAVYDAAAESIVLRAKGTKMNRLSLMRSVSQELESLHSSFKEIKVSKRIPCICSACRELAEPHSYDFEQLMEMRSDPHGKFKQCDHKPYKMVAVEDLLEGFESTKTPDGKQAPWARDLREVVIFLSSSGELKALQDQLDLFIVRENRRLFIQNVCLRLELREDQPQYMLSGGKQPMLNKLAAECDIFLGLYFTGIGEHCVDEFDHAWKRLVGSGRPFIFTYFQDSKVNIGELKKEEFQALMDFKDRLVGIGHVPNAFGNAEDLLLQFKRELDGLLSGILKEGDGWKRQ